METYQELKARHEKEVNALPLGFAFSEEQFEEMKLKLGVKENSELYRLGNTGGFYRKVDSELIHDTFKRHAEERKNAKKAERNKRQAEVEEAYDRLRKARNEYDSLRDAFVRDYGSLRMKVDVNDLGGFKDLFSYLNLG